jgi:hypothetical protein
MSIKDKYEVRPIQKEDTYPWLLKKHYAKRIPPISYAFGLYLSGILVGICTIGTPASSPLRAGVCGKENLEYVYELNRLCSNDILEKNSLSYFVGKVLNMQTGKMIIVSYADTDKNHHGYIYQATNWIYTGLSAKRTDWKLKGYEHLHGATIADKSRGQKKRAKYMRETYGEDFYLEERSRKHRYVYFIGSKRQKKEMLKNLNYEIKPYPKGDNKRYDASYTPDVQGLLF